MANVQRSQSSVLGNIFLEDTQVSHGVSDMINFILSQTSQAQAESAVITLRNSVHGGKRLLKTIKTMEYLHCGEPENSEQNVLHYLHEV